MELLRRFTLGAGLFAAALVAAPSVAAAGNALDTASVSPGSGTTATNFAFSVHYSSRRGHPASAVTASGGGKIVALALVSGTATDGVYRGVGRLPVGTWSVVFSAKVPGSRSPMLVGPTIAVAAATPTPAPTLKPVLATPVPKPVATPLSAPVLAPASPPPPRPAPVAVAPVVIPPRLPVAAPALTPKPKQAAAKPAAQAPVKSHAPAAAALTAPGGDAQELSSLMLGGLGVIGVVAAFWFLVADRRRRDPVEAALPEIAAAREEVPQAAPAPWEVDSRLEDQPIGTVDYLPLGASDAIGTLPPMQPKPRGTNPHAARLQAARSSRESYARDRSRLLKR